MQTYLLYYTDSAGTKWLEGTFPSREAAESRALFDIQMGLKVIFTIEVS